MTEIQSDTEFFGELLYLGGIANMIFREKFTRADIGVPDEDEIWHDALRVSTRDLDAADVIHLLRSLRNADGRRKQLDNSSNVR